MISVQRLIHLYCGGDAAAGEELLLRFAPYLLKFRKLLYAGVFDPNDVECVKFLRLFGRRDISDTARWVSKKIRTAYTLEDIEQDLRLCLLLCVKTYCKVRGYYVYVLYKYVVRNLLKDPLVRNWAYSIQDGPMDNQQDLPFSSDVELALSELGSADAELFLEVYGRGSSLADAAEAVGYTYGQAKVRLHRMRSALRSALGTK